MLGAGEQQDSGTDDTMGTELMEEVLQTRCHKKAHLPQTVHYSEREGFSTAATMMGRYAAKTAFALVRLSVKTLI